jgi:HNH endonuclease
VRWKVIPGFSAYEVSDTGLVRRALSHTRQGWHGKKRGDLLTPYIGKYNRYTMINDDGIKKYCNVHRLVLSTFIGPPPTLKHHSAHWDDNKRNNNLSNLRWATKRENEEDKVRNGKILKGEDHWKARLTHDDIRKICTLKRAGIRCQEIANRFGVSLSHIYNVTTGRGWV